ncbi:hypothetical protein P152DRAFT_195834 [Eremomyces bilateralis CBS 781.70]|uniref:Uncharacterized protein n=1 Tax=Eremomyces bilateralis CBS 781.70 TaxID=1392243 RepID=A0A6G1GCX8_9PEZI|nr:uncharacterized protein P152DRAFT_195834 [Eremomyces bilateralis CBS 781.70]KAF1815751.1 hypothetical protein P152DRAFT_195834 [Eremomyces bilateralis CBS 781.70]
MDRCFMILSFIDGVRSRVMRWPGGNSRSIPGSGRKCGAVPSHPSQQRVSHMIRSITAEENYFPEGIFVKPTSISTFASTTFFLELRKILQVRGSVAKSEFLCVARFLSWTGTRRRWTLVRNNLYRRVSKGGETLLLDGRIVAICRKIVVAFSKGSELESGIEG